MNELIKLKDLATEINNEHETVVNACKSAVEHAMKAGELLIQAKSVVVHGEWRNWLKENCTFSERTAQAYMKLAKDYLKLGDSKAQRVADLPLRDALSLLSEPRHAQNALGLDDSCELSTNLRDGRLIVISPSAKHPGYFFVDCVNTDDWMAEGWSRPVFGEYVTVCLDVLEVPPETLWARDNNVEPRDESRWMKNDCPDKAANCIKLGIMPDE